MSEELGFGLGILAIGIAIAIISFAVGWRTNQEEQRRLDCLEIVAQSEHLDAKTC